MKKNLSKKFLTIVSLMLLGIIYISLNPLLRSENYIKDMLLEDTPIGTSKEEVMTYIKTKNLKIVNINEFGGFPDKNNNYIGYQSIQVDLGDYSVILVTNVTVFWGFDKELKLIDIRVWKTVNAL